MLCRTTDCKELNALELWVPREVEEKHTPTLKSRS
jgi:hypothetical protein